MPGNQFFEDLLESLDQEAKRLDGFPAENANLAQLRENLGYRDNPNFPIQLQDPWIDRFITQFNYKLNLFKFWCLKQICIVYLLFQTYLR